MQLAEELHLLGRWFVGKGFEDLIGHGVNLAI